MLGSWMFDKCGNLHFAIFLDLVMANRHSFLYEILRKIHKFCHIYVTCTDLHTPHWVKLYLMGFSMSIPCTNQSRRTFSTTFSNVYVYLHERHYPNIFGQHLISNILEVFSQIRIPKKGDSVVSKIFFQDCLNLKQTLCRERLTLAPATPTSILQFMHLLYWIISLNTFKNKMQKTIFIGY